MAKLVWDQTGKRLYETGSDRCVLYKQSADGSYPKGVAWNGFTGLTESPSGAEPTKLYANNGVYVTLTSAEEFGATLTSYMFPDEFGECDGSAEPIPGVSVGQQKRSPFGLCYRTLIGNDTEGESHGYKLHMIYGAKVSPSEKAYQTVNDSPEATEMSWEINTTPVQVEGYEPTALITVDSTKVDSTKLKALEDILYGSTTEEARLPLPDEIFTILKNA